MTDEELREEGARILVHGLACEAYVVSPASESEYDHAVLVYAQSEALALEIGAPLLDGGEPEWCQARRAPEHDHRAADRLAGGPEEDAEYLRTIGWHMEGELSCGSCGLHAMGLEKYGVCRVSNLCKECGCGDADEENGGPCAHEEGFSCE